MSSKYRSGFDFVSANPSLHSGAKRLQLPLHTDNMLTTFSSLVNEITDEFLRFLRTKFKDVKFISNHLPKNMKLDPKMPLATLLSHCFPILYGLQQRNENTYQKMVNAYLRSRLSETENKTREKIGLLIHTFHQLTESKQLRHIIAKKTEMAAINYLDDQQLTLLVKQEIQSHCNALATAFNHCKSSVATGTKEQNVFSGLISRAKGFSSYTAKKLLAHCSEGKIA